MKNALKYKKEIDQICQNGYICPPSNAEEKTIAAYRWCASPMTASCFAPQGVRNPPRLAKATELSEKCSCWGLSMHASYESSVKAFNAVEKSFPKARKIFGGYVALGVVLPQHGRVTPPDINEHFDFHENAGANIASVFSLLSSVPK